MNQNGHINLTKNRHSFQVGQTVWVLGLRDILKTLDVDGKLDGLSFMPEMIPYCGKPFRVSGLPNRTCVERNGIYEFSNVVFLEGLRCDGGAHDGCQRQCLLFWREAWLSETPPTESINDADVAAIVAARFRTKKGERYLCQSTELADAATKRVEDHPGFGKRWAGDLYDLRLGNIKPAQFLRHILDTILNRLKRLEGIDTDNVIRGGLQKTPSTRLNLQPGDLVQVRSREEIAATLDASGKNKGLLFTPPMLQYCGKRYRVASRLQKMILEETGKMVQMKDTVVLDGVTCQAWGCQRLNLFYWREIWLKGVEPDSWHSSRSSAPTGRNVVVERAEDERDVPPEGETRDKTEAEERQGQLLEIGTEENECRVIYRQARPNQITDDTEHVGNDQKRAQAFMANANTGIAWRTWTAGGMLGPACADELSATMVILPCR